MKPNNSLTPVFPVDFNKIRTTLIREIQKVCFFDANHVIVEEPEVPNEPRPTLPYMSMKIITPAAKSGDDDKRLILENDGTPTDSWNSGGQRKMSVSFNAYGNSHEEAYNYMTLWQTALDLDTVQEDLRKAGIAVWVIGNVADLSQLLNTAYEGRAHLDVSFGIAVNLIEVLGEMDAVGVTGTVQTDTGPVTVNETVTFDD